MANKKRRCDQNYGHLTSLAYFPSQADGDGPGRLEVGRKLFDNPRFHVLRPFESVTAAPKLSEVQDEPLGRKTKRLQRRWLKNSHPQACWASGAISELLDEEAEYKRSEGLNLLPKPLIAVGEITDVRAVRHAIKSTPALAMSAGESGQILRILRLTEDMWQWGEHKDVLLNLWKITPSDNEDEVFWARDAVSISRIKFAVDLKGGAPNRWLIVQKRTSTTILRPTYHSVPVAVDGAALPQYSASRVDPLEVLSLTVDQTGGNSHSDVSFNPRGHGRPPQIVIIDECGYWSIWNIIGKLSVSSTIMQASLYKCGRFGGGPLDNLVNQPRHPAEPFGLLWCPPSVGESDDWNSDMLSSAGSDVPVKLSSVLRSRTILMWNRTALYVLDSDDCTTCSVIPLASSNRWQEVVLDVQSNPADRSQALVLTTHRLSWIDVCPSGEDARDVPPSILRSFIHNHAGDLSIELSTCCESDSAGKTTGLAFLYAQKDARVSVFWLFSASDTAGSPQYHHQLQFLERDMDPGLDKLHKLMVLPARLRSGKKGEQDEGPGTEYRDLGVQFYQVFKFGKRASLAFSICATTQKRVNGLLAPTMPTKRVWAFQDRPRRQRRTYVTYMSNKFVLPSNMEHFESLVKYPAETKEGPLEFEPWPTLDQKASITRRFGDGRFKEPFEASVLGGKGMFFPSALDSLREVLNKGIEMGRLSLKSIPECIKQHQRAHEPRSQSELEVDDSTFTLELGHVLGLSLEIDVESVRPYFKGFTIEELDEGLSDLSRQLLESWSLEYEDSVPEPALARRDTILRATSRDICLAYHTVGVGSMSTTQSGKQRISMSQPLPNSDQATHSSSQARKIEEAEKKLSASQALKRLNDVATKPVVGTKELSKLTQHSCLTRWDEALEDNYNPFIEKADAQHQEQIMERKARAEERSQRKQDEFRRLMGADIPSASQPTGSFSRGIPVRIRQDPMSLPRPASQELFPASQPVPGAFAQRRPVKRRKFVGIR